MKQKYQHKVAINRLLDPNFLARMTPYLCVKSMVKKQKYYRE